MTEPVSLQGAVEKAVAAAQNAPEKHKPELELLVKDLNEARTTLFVRTAEARPMVERVVTAARLLGSAAEGPVWDDAAESAFEEFDRAVSKLRNTILVRTQRAT